MKERRGFFSLVTVALLFIIIGLSTPWTEGKNLRCMHRYGLKCYRFNETKQMWATAHPQISSQEDESLAFSMAVPNSSEKRDWLRDLIMFFGHDVWIGLRRDQGTWRWMNGQPYVMDSSDWVPGSPGTGLGEACAHASPCTKGKWKEANCSMKKGFFSNINGINGGWGSWAGWSTCSKSCGTGTQYRTRSCDKPRQVEPGEPCHGHSNENRFCNGPYRCPMEWATCEVAGDPHYFTFDRARFDFQGADGQGRECRFLLAGRCSDDSPLPAFKILSLNKHIWSPFMSWLNAVELKYHDHVIKVDMSFLKTGAIFVDNLRVNADNYRGVRGVTVTKLRDQVRLSFEDGLVYVSLDSQRKVVIGIDKCLIGTKGLCGLCGNYDGHRLNDLNLRNGTKSDTWNDLGWSYLEPNADGLNCRKHFIPTCDVTDCARGKMCDPLKQPEVFGKCVERYNAHDACVTDLCCTPAFVDMCELFKGYADTCARIGHPVPPSWQVQVKCHQPKCPANSKYDHAAGACQETCTGPIDGCRDVAMKGTCVCNPGHVWYRNACIRKEHCGCVSESGEIHPLASTWRDRCCTKEYFCHKNRNGKPVIKAVSVKCHPAARCRLIDGKYECQCASGFRRHGHTCLGFACPSNETKLYRDPVSCKSYYICMNGKSYKGTCGYMLKFDDTTKGCIMMEDCPEQDTCAIVRGKPPRVRRMVAAEIEGWVGDGKFTCPQPDGAFPNPGTCRQFYACVNGNAIEGECAEGSNFSPEQAKCVMTKVKGC